MMELLPRPDKRAKSSRRGTRLYDSKHMGYADDGAWVLDTAVSGNAASGHDYGTALTIDEKLALIESLKTQ
jgi:hypothetical protein